MFEKVTELGLHPRRARRPALLEAGVDLRQAAPKNAGKPRWSFIDGPITANNPMGVHHAWGRTYKDVFQRYFAMTGHDQRYQNGFDCQGLWVEVEVERELQMGAKAAIEAYGIDKFVNACKQRVLQFAARQTEQSIRLGYWMDWDDPGTLATTFRNDRHRSKSQHHNTVAAKQSAIEPTRLLRAWAIPNGAAATSRSRLRTTRPSGRSSRNAFERGKLYRGHDVMPWSGRAVAARTARWKWRTVDGSPCTARASSGFRSQDAENEYLLVWTTTPWTLTSNVAVCGQSASRIRAAKAKPRQRHLLLRQGQPPLSAAGAEFKEGFGRRNGAGRREFRS